MTTSSLPSSTNLKKNIIFSTDESYGSRASDLMDALYIRTGLEGPGGLSTDQLSKLTKKDIVDFANKYFQDNYVFIYKRKRGR